MLPDPVGAWGGAAFARHYYASLRASVKVVQRRLGRSKAAETLDTYTHLWPDEGEGTRDAIQAVLADVPKMCPQREAAGGNAR